MKFKGHILKLNTREFTLKEQLGQGGFSMIYSTNRSESICKIQMISQTNIAHAYNNEKIALTNLTHKNIVKLLGCKQQKFGESNVGFMILENCNRGTAFDILDKQQGNVPEPTVLRVMHSVASALQFMHSKGFSHRDIKLENVLVHQNGELKLCDFGSSTNKVTKLQMQTIEKISKQDRANIEEDIQKTTTPIYRSPEQLDLYSGFPIGHKVDVFALGVMGFIMCFKKQPFESRLSAINNQFFLPEQHIYSNDLIKILEACFTCDPRQRPSAKVIKDKIGKLIKRKKAHIELNFDRQFNQTVDELSHISEKAFKQTSVAESSLLTKIKRLYNQITTETEGWIISFIEDNEEAPNLKFNRSIISKCWEKRYKVEKFYNILWRFSEEYNNKSLVTLKLLTLLHNFLRKGPKEAITYDKHNSPIKLCEKIYMRWKVSERPTNQEDIKRNSFVVLMIRMYCLIIIGKVRLCYENSDLFEGNYSILPFFKSKDEQSTLLKLPIIEQLIQYMEVCTWFHQQLQRNSYLIDIQRTILLSMVDEEYCLVSTLVFILSAFKNAISYVKDELNIEKLDKKIRTVQSSFNAGYQRLIELFSKNSKLASLFEHNHFELSPKVIDYIENISITNDRKNDGNFDITKYLNYKNNIHGLKIPLTYEQVVKNPDFLKDMDKNQLKSKEYIEINEFKAVNSPRQPSANKQKIKEQSETPQFQNADSLKSPKENKHYQSKFSSFTLEMDPNNNLNSKDSNKDLFNTMQFTHQNLNQDFMSTDREIKTVKEDKFADFMSIVKEKYEGEKKIQKVSQQKPVTKDSSLTHPIQESQSTKIVVVQKTSMMKQKQQEDIYGQGYGQGKNLNNIAQEVYMSVKEPEKITIKKEEIKKIELINFFDDEDDEEMATIPQDQKKAGSEKKIEEQLRSINEMEYLEKNTKKQIKQRKNQEEEAPEQKSTREKKETTREKLAKKQEQKIEREKKEMIEQIKEVNIIDESSAFSKTTDSFVDLKGFIVEEVKKNAQQYFIDYSTLRFKKKIGFGHSSEVFKGQWRGREVAIKKIKDDISSPNAQKQFRREIMTSIRIRHHPQLVTLIGVAQHDNYYYIINQYCQGATLFDILHESRAPLPWKTRISMAKQIATGMVFLHTNEPPIIHRDLKSLNVLLVNKYTDKHPENMQIKIADFGLSRDFASTYMTGTLGTYHWMAPQIFNNEPYSLKADVYSFGIVLWEIMARKPPYLNMKNPQALMKFITVEDGRPDMRQLPQDCPSSLKELMVRCWDKYPSNRPDFEEILSSLRKIEFF